MPSDLIHKYMRIDHLPHIWCAGCGNGVLTRDVAVAIDQLCSDPENPLDREKIVIVSGIGCSSRAAGYLDFNSIHTTHGRAIAFATGIKLANPTLTVIVLTGDGDCSAIGGNHLIHAARRNVDMTVVVFNNNIYGMTGGQYSPTTPRRQGHHGALRRHRPALRHRPAGGGRRRILHRPGRHLSRPGDHGPDPAGASGTRASP
jgi:2-oxoglutarate ferredoxin oxidoreductase subunit beta